MMVYGSGHGLQVMTISLILLSGLVDLSFSYVIYLGSRQRALGHTPPTQKNPVKAQVPQEIFFLSVDKWLQIIKQQRHFQLK